MLRLPKLAFLIAALMSVNLTPASGAAPGGPTSIIAGVRKLRGGGGEDGDCGALKDADATGGGMLSGEVGGVRANVRRQGAISGDEFLPDPLPHPCELPPHLYPQRRYEHGDEPGLRDSEDESEYQHLKNQNGGAEPDYTPGWAKHLHMKLRIAQNGHLGVINPQALDVAGLCKSDATRYEHQSDVWDRVCGKMVDLMEPACGHNVLPFEQTRQEMYRMMKEGAPATPAQRALRAIARNQLRNKEAELLRKAHAGLRIN